MLDADAIDAATTMIDTRAWRSAALKFRIVQVVKLNTLRNPRAGDGVPLGARYIAKALGLGVSRVQVVLRELVAERVLLVIAAGVGSRGTVYELGEPRGWRVPWSIDPELVETRIAMLTGRLVVTNPRFARASWGRAQPLVANTAWPRALNGAGEHSQGARATANPARAAWGRAQAIGDSGAAPISEIEDQSIDRGTPTRIVKAAIAERLGAPVGNRFGDRIAAALAGVDHEPILAKLREASPTLGLELLVQLVEQLADAQAHRTHEPAPEPAPRADPDCPGCSGHGMLEVEPNVYERCPCSWQRRTAVAAVRDDAAYVAVGGIT